ncbi:PA domain-containing protein, partial [Actinoplanes sp. NPDC051633]|uniref:PA domain-containing protein n=1 Tax=Actinoplanes sp. NPDC051633 TaxID=3155670 RepID=UPI003424F913
PAGAVGSIAPWVTTVAAGTHDRVLTRTLRLGDGAILTGTGQGATALPSARVVDAVAGAAVPADAELCKAGSLNRSAVAGAIVLCKRGVNGRTDKSRTVRDAGGVGMVLYNDPDSTLDVDFHAVPTVHLNRADGLRVKAYAATAGATARLDAAVRGRTRAPAVAATSSAGPARIPSGPLLKPDLLAPGVSVLAATAAAGVPTFGVRSGSSVAAAQVSGAGALLLGRTPTLSPTAVRSRSTRLPRPRAAARPSRK